MAVEKLSISMDADLAREVRRAAAAENEPVSTWIADLLARQLRRQRLRAWLDEYEAEHGAFTAEEIAQARQDLKIDEVPWT